MSKIPPYLKSSNKILTLYLTGIRGYFYYTSSARSKTSYFSHFTLLGTFFGVSWFLHKMKTEFYQRERPNFFIPMFLYESRRDHYLYYEITRIARKLPTTFVYYYYDDITDFTWYVDLKGNHEESKNVFTQEKVEYSQNLQFEKIYRQYYWGRTPELIRIGNALVAYNKFINNRWELDNYLHHKTVNLMDWIRAFWWLFQTHLGFTNKYYYDHIIDKPDAVYELEKAKIALNLPDFADENSARKYVKVMGV